MSFQPRPVIITIEVTADTTETPGLIVHKAWNADNSDPGWTVSHQATGKKISASNFMFRHNAFKFAAMLQKAADWTQANPMQDWSKERKQKILDFREKFLAKDQKEYLAQSKEEAGSPPTTQTKTSTKKRATNSKRR